MREEICLSAVGTDGNRYCSRRAGGRKLATVSEGSSLQYLDCTRIPTLFGTLKLGSATECTPRSSPSSQNPQAQFSAFRCISVGGGDHIL